MKKIKKEIELKFEIHSKKITTDDEIESIIDNIFEEVEMIRNEENGKTKKNKRWSPN